MKNKKHKKVEAIEYCNSPEISLTEFIHKNKKVA